MTRARWLGLVALVVAVLGACGSGTVAPTTSPVAGPPTRPTTRPATTTTTTPSTTVTSRRTGTAISTVPTTISGAMSSTIASTTTPGPLPPMRFATPQTALNALVGAWQRGDKRRGLATGDAAAVEALFSKPPPVTFSNGGCRRLECSISWAENTAYITMEGSDQALYAVAGVEFET